MRSLYTFLHKCTFWSVKVKTCLHPSRSLSRGLSLDCQSSLFLIHVLQVTFAYVTSHQAANSLTHRNNCELRQSSEEPLILISPPFPVDEAPRKKKKKERERIHSVWRQQDISRVLWACQDALRDVSAWTYLFLCGRRRRRSRVTPIDPGAVINVHGPSAPDPRHIELAFPGSMADR